MANSPQGIITDIQHFSVHDGPGIRTTIFFKGCNQRCFWCHNPETLKPQPQLQLYLNRCIACGACFDRCPQGAHVMTADGGRIFRRDLCLACGECVDTCYAQALVLIGETKTAAEIIDVVLRDRTFYATSGGGVTLSGGEPLLQIDFACAILEGCHAEGIHTAIETAANVPWERIARILHLTDLVMMDIKLLDDARHREHVGVPNGRILENARHLGQQDKPLIVRTPVVPGVNDDHATIAEIAEFVAELPNLLYYELLPYHGMAQSKYDSLEMAYQATLLKTPSTETMDTLTATAERAGIHVHHT